MAPILGQQIEYKLKIQNSIRCRSKIHIKICSKSVEISSLASGQWSQSQHQGQASSSSSQ
ncbi:hypothetical protein H5410_053896 [Solanum commersonii]|uniref:Uncharacterized protein n=1 Tax=Solanum commersonii TaxID=4109 RepID=A0A9J5X742_SOLCO|nr:hypothetical protein H5410_053896 [Solanum commersonii]